MDPSERIVEITARLTEIRAIPDDDITDERLTEAETLMTERGELDEQVTRDDRRAAILTRADTLLAEQVDNPAAREGNDDAGQPDPVTAPAVHRSVSYELDRYATDAQVRDQAMHAIEAQVEPWNATGAESAERLVRRSTAVARHITTMSDPAYQDVFRACALGGRSPDRDEQMIIDRAAVAVGTNTQGGFMVPTRPRQIPSASGGSRRCPPADQTSGTASRPPGSQRPTTQNWRRSPMTLRRSGRHRYRSTRAQRSRRHPWKHSTTSAPSKESS